MFDLLLELSPFLPLGHLEQWRQRKKRIVAIQKQLLYWEPQRSSERSGKHVPKRLTPERPMPERPTPGKLMSERPDLERPTPGRPVAERSVVERLKSGDPGAAGEAHHRVSNEAFRPISDGSCGRGIRDLSDFPQRNHQLSLPLQAASQTEGTSVLWRSV